MVGIDWHLERSMEQGTLDFNQLWFATYLKSHPTESEDGMARVTIFLRVVRRTESLCLNFCQSRMYDYQMDCGGRATHLVEQVDYGAEFVCCLRRPVDWLSETKESAEENICLAAKSHFNGTNGPTSELDKVSCIIYSSLNTSQRMKGSFRQSCKWLDNTIRSEDISKWRPVEIVLRHVHTQLETRVLSEKMEKNRLEMRRNWHWIWNESQILSSHKFLQQLPPFEAALLQFHDLLHPLWSRIEEMNAFHTAVIPESVFIEQKPFRDLLANLMDWVADRRCEIKSISSLLGDTKLAIFDLANIEARPLLSSEMRANVFILRLYYKRDQLIEFVQKITGGKSINFKRPVFPLVFSDVERFRAVEGALRKFVEDARWCTNPNNSYQIGLVPASSQLDDGEVNTILFSAKKSFNKYQATNEEKLFSGRTLHPKFRFEDRYK